jgi:hypothetical protein
MEKTLLLHGFLKNGICYYLPLMENVSRSFFTGHILEIGNFAIDCGLSVMSTSNAETHP